MFSTAVGSVVVTPDAIAVVVGAAVVDIVVTVVTDVAGGPEFADIGMLSSLSSAIPAGLLNANRQRLELDK